MTAAAHLASFEAAGDAAVHAHLMFSHRERLRQLGLDGPTLAGQSAALLHRRVHDDECYFPTEAPA